MKNSKIVIETDVVIFPIEEIQENSRETSVKEKRNKEMPLNASDDMEILNRNICTK